MLNALLQDKCHANNIITSGNDLVESALALLCLVYITSFVTKGV
jgi:hypothetical protein